MTFTDDDLKRLKEMLYHDCRTCEDHAPLMPFDGSPIEKTKALLVRLEAAETLCNHVEKYFDPSDYGRRLYKAWRKAKGEAG